MVTSGFCCSFIGDVCIFTDVLCLVLLALLHYSCLRRVVLVVSVVTAIAIYYLMVLNLPVEVLKKIDSLRRAYLWAGCDKVSGGKFKINWEQVCKSKLHGGLGILN